MAISKVFLCILMSFMLQGAENQPALAQLPDDIINLVIDQLMENKVDLFEIAQDLNALRLSSRSVNQLVSKKISDAIISKQIDPSARNVKALRALIASGNEALKNLLANNGARLDEYITENEYAINFDENNALINAIKIKDYDLIKHLKHTVSYDIVYEAIDFALYVNDFTAFKLLLIDGQYGDAFAYLSQSSLCYSLLVPTALHKAAFYNREEIIDYLLSIPCTRNKKYIDAKDNHGKTALHIAAAHGRLGIAKKLLAAGCEFYSLDLSDKMAFTWASEYYYPEIAQEILQSIDVKESKFTSEKEKIQFIIACVYTENFEYLKNFVEHYSSNYTSISRIFTFAILLKKITVIDFMLANYHHESFASLTTLFEAELRLEMPQDELANGSLEKLISQLYKRFFECLDVNYFEYLIGKNFLLLPESEEFDISCNYIDQFILQLLDNNRSDLVFYYIKSRYARPNQNYNENQYSLLEEFFDRYLEDENVGARNHYKMLIELCFRCGLKADNGNNAFMNHIHAIGNYLCWATRNNLLEIVSILLQHQADVDHIESHKAMEDDVYYLWTPLMIAIENRFIDIIKLLLEQDPHTDYTTPNGISALTLADESSDEIKELVLKANSSKKRKLTD